MSIAMTNELVLETNARGVCCARLGGRQLHSTMDPVREADKMVQSSGALQSDTVILFGAGLGYVLEALFEQTGETRILVAEPHEELARAVVQYRHEALAPILASSRVEFVFCPAPVLLVSLLQDAGARNPVLLANPAIKAAFPREYKDCEEGLALFQQRSIVNSNTLKRFGGLWVKNFARNRHVLTLAGSVKTLEEQFEGIPGLVLAGGPGLDLVLPLLAELKKRMVLVAVDTSLRACLRHGVDPDVVVTMDPQYWNSRHLDWTSQSRALVVTESSIYPQSLRKTAGSVAFCTSYFPLARWYEERLGLDFGKLGAGGSVATSAWDLLRIMGCSESWIAGLDLSCPGGKTHFHGALFEEQVHGASRRTHTAEQQRFDYLYNDASYAVTTEEGSRVMTDQRMDMYAQWFEAQATLYPQRVQYRLGEGNRPIRGLMRSSPEAALKAPVIRHRIDQALAAARPARPAAYPHAHSSGGSKRIAFLDRELSESLNIMETLSREALELIKKLEVIFGTESTPPAPHVPGTSADAANLMKRLDTIDRELMDNPDSRIPGFLMEAEIREILQTNQLAGNGLAASRRIYEAMLRVTRQHLEIFHSR